MLETALIYTDTDSNDMYCTLTRSLIYKIMDCQPRPPFCYGDVQHFNVGDI